MWRSEAIVSETRKVAHHRSAPACLAIVLGALVVNILASTVSAQERSEFISASFTNKPYVAPDEQIELGLSHELNETDGRVTVFINNTDVTSLFPRDKLRLRYNARLWPLPLGSSPLIVYLAPRDGEWKEIARFTLRVEKRESARLREGVAATDSADVIRPDFTNNKLGGPLVPAANDNLTAPVAGEENGQEASSSQQGPASHKRRMKFVPSLTLTIPSQPAQSTFPGPQPERATFTEVNLQASVKNEAAIGIFTTQSSFDFAGSSFEKEALRFGTLGNNAPKVDLSSYLIQFQTGKIKYQVGHFSFGTQRQLINSFASRGISLTVPFLKRFDFTAAAMNGTQLVGYDNFFGLNKRRHQMLSGTLGVELLAKRPGGLRLEIGVLNAYFQPISGVNRGVVTDLQRSRGVSLRLIASSKDQRFHFDGGFTRSFFASPSDTTLSQGVRLVPLPALSRNAHYLEASYEILRGYALSKTKKVNLSVGFKEENVAPLFRSLGASTQADKVQYELSVNASLNEITGQFSHVNFHDNLREIPSILRTLNGNTHFSLAAPASALLNRTKSSPWLPRLGYSFDRIHAFGAAIPVNGGFEINLSTIPNLVGTNQTFTADWQVKKFTIGYNMNHSFQDNRQPGRERADLGVLVNTGRIGIVATSKLNLNFDLSAERSTNKETARIDHTYRVGPGFSWQMTKHMSLSSNLSNTIAGDAANTTHSRNTEFDGAWTYRFARGKEGWRKMSGQFFIRYANHYSHSFAPLFSTDTLRKNQTLSANLGITFF